MYQELLSCQASPGPLSTGFKRNTHDQGDVVPKSSLTHFLLQRPRPVRLRRKLHHMDEEAGMMIFAPMSSQHRTDTSRKTGLTQSINQSPTKTGVLKDEYAKLFSQRIAESTPCVFLCVGQPEKCRIVQIKLKEDDDHVAIFTKMSKSWHKFRKRLHFRRVARVEEVTVCVE